MTKPTIHPDPTPTIRIYRGRSQTAPGESYPAHLVAMYEFIEGYIAVNQYPPTNREMVDHKFAKSTSVIRFYYERMILYGMIEVIPGIARGIRIHPRKEWKKNAKIQSHFVTPEVRNEQHV